MNKLVTQDSHVDPTEYGELWHAWHNNQDFAARDRLIECHLPFARMLAAKLYGKRHCKEFEFDDYLQFATIGLLEAIDRFESGSEATFKTYASKRINGAVLNGVERLSDRQQQISTRQNQLAERSAYLSKALDPSAYNDNLFDQLAEIAVGLALGHILDGTLEHQDDEHVQPDDHYRSTEMRQLREHLLASVEQLPERERLLIKYNYFNNIAFDTVAQQWGVTRGRIAQIHRSALMRLRQSSIHLRQYDVYW